MVPISIAIATDHRMIGDAIEAMLQRYPDLRVSSRGDLRRGLFPVATADVGLALPMFGELHTCLHQRVSPSPEVRGRIIVIDPRETLEARRALESGYSGVLLTTMTAALLARAISVVHQGGEWIEKTSVMRTLRRDLVTQSGSTLTDRERQIAEMVVIGMRNREIAESAGISESTVKVHIRNIFSKLEVDSRTKLTIAARAIGITAGPAADAAF